MIVCKYRIADMPNIILYSPFYLSSDFWDSSNISYAWSQNMNYEAVLLMGWLNPRQVTSFFLLLRIMLGDIAMFRVSQSSFLNNKYILW